MDCRLPGTTTGSMQPEQVPDGRRTGACLLHGVAQLVPADAQFLHPISNFHFLVQVDRTVGDGLALQVIAHDVAFVNAALLK